MIQFNMIHKIKYQLQTKNNKIIKICKKKEMLIKVKWNKNYKLKTIINKIK